jgi:protease I
MLRKVLILVDNGFEDMEAMYPYYRMQEAGLEVVVAAPRRDLYHGKWGYPLRATKTLEECDLSDFIAIVIPGGYSPDRLRTSPLAVELVRNAMKTNTLVAAICHGPQLLVEANAVRGRKLTGYSSIKKDLQNAGARYEDAAVVVDRNLITSRTPDDLPVFASTLIAMLYEKALAT